MLVSLMKRRFPSFHFAITATTRPKRANEADGVDYYFYTGDDFKRMIEKGELLEWSQVYGNYYGVPAGKITQALQKGQNAVLKVDVQGARKIKDKIPGAILIFVAPPSAEALAERLRKRKTENAEDLKIRLDTSQEEMKTLPMFNYVVVNEEGRIEETMEQMEKIIASEKHRDSQRKRLYNGWHKP